MLGFLHGGVNAMNIGVTTRCFAYAAMAWALAACADASVETSAQNRDAGIDHGGGPRMTDGARLPDAQAQLDTGYSAMLDGSMTGAPDSGVQASDAAQSLFDVGRLDQGETPEVDAADLGPEPDAAPRCGDGRPDPGEACDDGNALNTDDCTNECEWARCGDGYLWDGQEACDDGNALNTDACTDACQVARCGDGFVWVGEEACDDGNAVNTDGCTDGCRLAMCGDGLVWDGEEECDNGDLNGDGVCSDWCTDRYDCPRLPAVCPDLDEWGRGLPDHHMRSVEGCRFALQAPTDAEWAEGEALADALIEAHGPGRTLAQVLQDTNRTMRATLTRRSQSRMENHDTLGFMWNDGDNDVSYWMPQGLTGNEDGGNALGVDRRTMMVSWYHKTDDRPTKGVRISIVDMETDPPQYRHVLLIEPHRAANGALSYGPAEYDGVNPDALHAGGLVWYGPYLYVADTHEGMRVFDLRRMMAVSNTRDRSRIGVIGGVTYGAGYEYVLPQVARYRRARLANGDYASCAVKFSSIGLDRTQEPHSILSAEYHRDERYGRAVSWDLDPVTFRLDARAGVSPDRDLVRGRDAVVTGEEKMQGALRAHGIYYISSSSQTLTRYGRLYRNRPGRGESLITAWPYGCEDLYYEGTRNRIWTVTEYAGARELIGIPRQNEPQ